MNNEKAPDGDGSELSALLDSVPAITASKAEEVIAGLWIIAALLAFGFGYSVWGYIFAVKAAMGTAASIWYALRRVRALRAELAQKESNR